VIARLELGELQAVRSRDRDGTISAADGSALDQLAKAGEHDTSVRTGEHTRAIGQCGLVGEFLLARLLDDSFAEHECTHGFGQAIDQGFCFAESGSIPVSGIAPAVLVSELEMQQRSTTGYHEPLLPPPFADDGSRGRTGRLRERGRRRRSQGQ